MRNPYLHSDMREQSPYPASRKRRRWLLLLLLLLCGLFGIVTASLLGDAATRDAVRADPTGEDANTDTPSRPLLGREWAFDGDLFESLSTGERVEAITLPTTTRFASAEGADNSPERRRVVTNDRTRPYRQLTQPRPAGRGGQTLDDLDTGPNQTQLVELLSGVSVSSASDGDSTPFSGITVEPPVVIPTPTAAAAWLTVVATLAATRRRRRG